MPDIDAKRTLVHQAGPAAKAKVGNKINPEAHARHLIGPPPTRGIAIKVTQAPSASHNAPVLPAFAAVASTPVKHTARINNIDFSAVCWFLCVRVY